MGESYPDFSPSFTRDPAQYHGQRFEQPQQFLLHVSPGALLFPSPISLSNVSVGLVCISFPFCSRLPPGICATATQKLPTFSLHGNSGTFPQFGAQLSPGEPLFPFALSFLLNEKMGSFLPATASATKCCPSFQCCSRH